MNFTQQDILQIDEKGLSTKEVENQIEIFKRGNLKVNITEAATVGNGISAFSTPQKEELIAHYELNRGNYDIIKFVPASGAASRMFKALYSFITDFDPENQKLSNYLDSVNDKSLGQFFNKIERLPFYQETLTKTKENYDNFEDYSQDMQYKLLVESMLDEEGLNLKNRPKGLVPFHQYNGFSATAFEEHLIEAAEYIAVNTRAALHFTVAKGDKKSFEKEWENCRSRVEELTGVEFKITYSFQDPKTDTIAVNPDFEVFRTEENQLFFRPGGHGALIENLNNLESDIVFIKNIDNVVIRNNIGIVAIYKKALGGQFLKIQEKIYEYQELLESTNLTSDRLKEISGFLEKELFIKNVSGKPYSSDILKQKLNRPLRICGMVKNEGEPGGGPFLVKDENGEISLQIIESAQIDKSNPKQMETANAATHFNPVDMVCGLKNYKGKAYNLADFVDETMSFIADKTKDGKALKALERPGLWNGGMAKWNTVFVEVPVATFNPVKTVVDFLKPSHQP